MSTNYTPELYDTAKIEYDMKRAEGVPAHALNAHLNVFLESNGIASIDVRKEIIDRLISDDHIRQSWELVKQIGLETAGVLFFKNIFEEAPGALQLFSFKDEVPLYESRKLKAHGLAVMTHVGYAVAGLRDINALVPVLARLGAKHNGKNITPEHFDLIGSNLIKTLDMALGDKFTPEVRKAWTDVYGVVASSMKSAMIF